MYEETKGKSGEEQIMEELDRFNLIKLNTHPSTTPLGETNKTFTSDQSHDNIPPYKFH